MWEWKELLGKSYRLRRGGDYSHKRKIMSLKWWKRIDLKGSLSSDQSTHLVYPSKVPELKKQAKNTRVFSERRIELKTNSRKAWFLVYTQQRNPENDRIPSTDLQRKGQQSKNPKSPPQHHLPARLKERYLPKSRNLNNSHCKEYWRYACSQMAN